EARREADRLHRENEAEIAAIKAKAQERMERAVSFIREGIVKAHGSR
ncbi:MAG TPA: hypothetical protein GX507_00545, partial [Clostridia bacterium]|nr:hypothetical protein [Clostridia bacterium]